MNKALNAFAMLLCTFTFALTAQERPMPDSAKVVQLGVKYCSIQRIESDSSRILFKKVGYDRRGNICYQTNFNADNYHTYSYDAQNRISCWRFYAYNKLSVKYEHSYDDRRRLDTIHTYYSYDTIKARAIVVKRFDEKTIYTFHNYQSEDHHTYFLYNINNKDSLKLDSIITKGYKSVSISTPEHLLEQRKYDVGNNLTQRCTYTYNSTGQILNITINNIISTVQYEFEYDIKGIRTKVFRNKKIIDNQELQNLLKQHPLNSTYMQAIEPMVTVRDSHVYEYKTIFNTQGLPIVVKVTDKNGSFLKTWTEIYTYEYY